MVEFDKECIDEKSAFSELTKAMGEVSALEQRLAVYGDNCDI